MILKFYFGQDLKNIILKLIEIYSSKAVLSAFIFMHEDLFENISLIRQTIMNNQIISSTLDTYDLKLRFLRLIVQTNQ